MKSIRSLCCLLLVFVVVTARSAYGDERVDQLIKEGNGFDEKFQPAKALDCYLPAEKLDPKNVDLLLRIARQYRHLMQDATKTNLQLKLGETAKTYALRAAALAPNDPETHLSVAISYAKMVPILGLKERLETSRLIKSTVDKVLALDPKKDLAWNILGCWHQRLADINMVKRAVAMVVYGGLPAASNEESVKCLKKAIELNPKNLLHFIELGRTYAQMGNAGEAKKYLTIGLAMPNVGKDDPDAKKRGRETLATLK